MLLLVGDRPQVQEGRIGGGVRPNVAAAAAPPPAPRHSARLVCDSVPDWSPSPPLRRVVSSAEDLAALTERNPEGTTFWLAPSPHVLAEGRYSFGNPRRNRYVGAPGAILDGRHTNQYAFGVAQGVRVEYLTVQRFGNPGESNGEGVVNHDAALAGFFRT